MSFGGVWLVFFFLVLFVFVEYVHYSLVGCGCQVFSGMWGVGGLVFVCFGVLAWFWWCGVFIGLGFGLGWVDYCWKMLGDDRLLLCCGMLSLL